jgi:hypothetical protein
MLQYYCKEFFHQMIILFFVFVLDLELFQVINDFLQTASKLSEELGPT